MLLVHRGIRVNTVSTAVAGVCQTQREGECWLATRYLIGVPTITRANPATLVEAAIVY